MLDPIKAVPERFTVDELLEHMAAVCMVEHGTKNLEAGKSPTPTQARKKLAQ